MSSKESLKKEIKKLAEFVSLKAQLVDSLQLTEIEELLNECRNLEESIVLLKHLPVQVDVPSDTSTLEANNEDVIIDVTEETHEEELENVTEPEVEAEIKDNSRDVEEVEQIEEETPTSTAEEPSKTQNAASDNKDNSIANRMQLQSISDLKKAMSLNDRFLFTNELFGGNGELFYRSVEELNHLQSMDDAMRLLNHSIIETYNWDFESSIVESFLNLLQRRYL